MIFMSKYIQKSIKKFNEKSKINIKNAVDMNISEMYYTNIISLKINLFE